MFEKIAKQFFKACGRFVTGEQCLRKWGKITSKQKEIEDHNNKSGNDKKTWKLYNELSKCLAKDATINPVCTMESSVHEQSADNQSSTSSCSITGSGKLSDESSSESTLDEPCNTSKKKRCRKRPKSRSSASEMLEFLKSYSNKREKMEEEKLKVLKEIKDEKSSFFNRFFDYLEKKKP